MNTEERHDPFDDSMTISERGLGFLGETAKWARFIAIVGFVGLAFMVIMSVVMFTVMGSLGDAGAMPGLSPYGGMGGFGAMSGTFFGIIYLVMAALYVFPLLYLYRFGTSTLAAIKNEDDYLIETALENLKSHYKFFGIFLIVILAIYALIFLFAIVGGMSALL